MAKPWLRPLGPPAFAVFCYLVRQVVFCADSLQKLPSGACVRTYIYTYECLYIYLANAYSKLTK